MDDLSSSQVSKMTEKLDEGMDFIGYSRKTRHQTRKETVLEYYQYVAKSKQPPPDD